MGLTTRYRQQTAVFWEHSGYDSEGAPTFYSPVEVLVRWEEKQEVIKGKNGKDILTVAEVLVGQDMKLDDYLFLGTLDDLDSAQDALTQDGAWPVASFEKIPNRKATDYVRTVKLTRGAMNSG